MPFDDVSEPVISLESKRRLYHQLGPTTSFSFKESLQYVQIRTETPHPITGVSFFYYEIHPVQKFKEHERQIIDTFIWKNKDLRQKSFELNSYLGETRQKIVYHEIDEDK